jgi:hypothetical protein
MKATEANASPLAGQRPAQGSWRVSQVGQTDKTPHCSKPASAIGTDRTGCLFLYGKQKKSVHAWAGQTAASHMMSGPKIVPLRYEMR